MRRFPKHLIVAALAAAVVPLAQVRAAGIWDGDTTGGNDSWGVAGNWDTGVVPVAFTGVQSATINTGPAGGVFEASIDTVTPSSPLDVTVGSSGVNGSLKMTGAALTGFGSLVIGSGSGTGVFNHSGGTVNFGQFNTATAVIIGNGAGSTGTYNMSGTAALNPFSGSTITVGNSTGTGTLNIAGNTITDTSTNAKMAVGVNGLIQGYGAYTNGNNASGPTNIMLTNNGRIVADGAGVDRSLSFATTNNAFGTANERFTNSIDNTTNKGIYAQNHGKVVVSGIAMGVNGTGAKEVNFGETTSANDATIDMVNSLRLAFNPASMTNATATISLLSDDRTDVVAAPSGIDFIGVWNLALTTGSVGTLSGINYQFRYDDVAAGGATPALYQLISGVWTLRTSSNDSLNHILSTTDSAINGFANTFAIGVTPVPEPATLGLLSLGALPLLSRRRR